MSDKGEDDAPAAQSEEHAPGSAKQGVPAATDGDLQGDPTSSEKKRPSQLQKGEPFTTQRVDFAEQPLSPSFRGQMSPEATDRVFPIRSVVSVDPASTPAAHSDRQSDRSDGGRAESGYFASAAHARRKDNRYSDGRQRQGSIDRPSSAKSEYAKYGRHSSASLDSVLPGQPLQNFSEMVRDTESVESGPGEGITLPASDRPSSRATKSSFDETGGLMTARFKHVVTEGGHAVITGRGGETLQRCEDEPIHIPGAVQGFGLLIALEEEQEGKLIVRIVSENSRRLIGYTPRQLFELDSFTDILSEEQADNLLDHVDFIRDEDSDVVNSGPEVFTMAVRSPERKSQKLWCAMHINDRHPQLLICEFELEDDLMNPLIPPNEPPSGRPEDTLDSQPTEAEFEESTHNSSKPLRVLRSARKRKGEAAAMEVFNIMSQVQEQLAAAPSLDSFLKVLVGVVKELTGFHRVMVYQFDQSWSGRVVTELVDPRATKDLYKGLNFPASDIPKQARDLYKINKVRMLYDRDQETARLVCRTMEDLETPLDLTHSYLRAMSPIHIKYLGNMAVRSSMSISINAFDELWGLISCHSYGSKGMRVSFPIRKMCRLVGDSASRNIERLSYASRLQARKLINTVPTQSNPSGYIIASSDDLLKLFDADFGLLSIRGETKIMGNPQQSQEPLAMLEYLRMRSFTSVMTSQDIGDDFPDLRYEPGFTLLAGFLLVPLSNSGEDFIVFFRRGQRKEVKWAGNPYEKYIKEGTEGYLEPRKSFKTWSETVVGKCREWTEEEIETAAVLCLVYGKFIEVWRQKEAALQNSQLTRLLLANSAHEVRTPLNAIINYLEIAMEGSLDQETRDNLSKSHSASKSLIYVINDLLDLTKTEEGGDLVKDEVFDLCATLREATDNYKADAKRKNITYEVTHAPELPENVIGDQRRVRQAISNITANAIQSTAVGGISVEMSLATRDEQHCEVEISVVDSGVGMSSQKLDQLFRELEQVQSEGGDLMSQPPLPEQQSLPDTEKKSEDRALGLGLALVARIIRNVNGQFRVKSEEGSGSRFTILLPFDLPDSEPEQQIVKPSPSEASVTPQQEAPPGPSTPIDSGEVTLVERDSASARRRPSTEPRRGALLSRENSIGSTTGGSITSKLSGHSIKSRRSNVSLGSNRSGKSEADRLVDAISEPPRSASQQDNPTCRPGSSHASAGGGTSTRPPFVKRHTTAIADSTDYPAKNRPRSLELTSNQRVERPGQSLVQDSGMPIRPIKMAEEGFQSSAATPSDAPSALASSKTNTPNSRETPMSPRLTSTSTSPDRMNVLVAEDDPVNSRIIQKRLEKLGHTVSLTPNGEECASDYCGHSGHYDIVLMDMQMPIVDGLSSAKMIRSFEKSHPTHLLSTRASLNGRVPIIAVSASLVERERQTYIDAGFDGWILKPVAFVRLFEIMRGIVDPPTRRANLYRQGNWESGGWFEEAQKDIFAADTRPDEKLPTSANVDEQKPSEGVKVAAAADDPFTREEAGSEQTQEQKRLAGEQAKERGEEPAPDIVAPETASESEDVTPTGGTATEAEMEQPPPAPEGKVS